ncbi:ATP-dependent zinc protease family protein [Marinospirillum alkaliphilum]|uniref:Uncharacterized conserved protein n=1 Tax=Marinospirillum alkaliphilum DSM 21637 TaxID=1122209 RepID=A0A1K1YF09_9GAMM|nr:RimK/LysX family protein [Marinospirillum alkaliphilum]SFX60326.1 Uncharacterized conserved protein [Marinospirillum alkaliphilum DSM 21637]
MTNPTEKIIIGAREVVCFPALNLCVRAKVDTGAKTSCLHATDIHVEGRKGQQQISFVTLDETSATPRTVRCQLPLLDRRKVRSSNGHSDWRYVVETEVLLGEFREKIQLTLADRSRMKYPMLLGRSAMEQHLLVAPGAAYLQGSL